MKKDKRIQGKKEKGKKRRTEGRKDGRKEGRKEKGEKGRREGRKDNPRVSFVLLASY